MESVRNGSVIKHTRPSFGPSLNAEATVFVVLTGVLVGLLLVFAVLCICRCCHKSSKSFKRQQVVFTKYSSEKRSSSGKGSRKSRSYEPSVVVDLEAAYSDSSTSPREVEGLSQGTASRNSPPDTSESHKFFSDKDIGRREAADDQHNGQCVVFERTSMALPSTSSSSPKTVVSVTLGCGKKRFPRSPPICRQSSVCDDSSEHSTPSRATHLDRELDLDQSPGRDRRQSSPAAIETAPQIVIPQVIVAFHNEVEEEEEEEGLEEEEKLPDCGKTRAEVYTYPYVAKCTSSETKREAVASATVPRRRSQRSMDLEEFEAKVALLRAAAAQLAPEIAKHGGAALSQSIAGLSPIVGAVMGVECLLRAPSTEVGKMEERMEERCRHNSHAMRVGSRMSHLSDEDEEPKAKVRYNDTGSLEEVNEQVLDSFVDDVDDLEEMRTEYVRAQYRKLWALRATYEEDVQQGADDVETEVAPRAEPEVTSAEPSHTTSFESNTEAVEGDQEGDSCKTAAYPRGTGSGSGEEPKPSAGIATQLPSTSPTGCCPGPSVDKLSSTADKCSTEGNCVSPPAPLLCPTPMLSAKLLLPNPESRRQSYKSMLNRRLRRLTTTTSTATTGSTPGGGSAENSFDSLETEDGSSTDGSRLEAVTTSIESTTDNTDSAGENQMNRLQQMKADSGYKSLETNGALQHLAPVSTSPDKFSDKRINWQVAVSREGPETVLIHYDPGGEMSAGKTVLEPMEHEEEEEEEELEQEGEELEQEVELEEEEEEDCEDEGVCGMMTSVEVTTSGDKDQDENKGTMSRVMALETVTLQEEVAERSSASRKRRNYVRERRVADSRLESVEEVGSNGHQCTIGRLFRAPRDRHQQSPFCPARALSRDYSIDEKSDALFREFSRLDPALEAVLETGPRASAPRLSRRHHRLYHHPPPPVTATTAQHHHKHHHYSSYCLHKQQLHEDVPMTAMTVRSKLSPQEGIEEEMMMMGAGTSGLLMVGDASRSGGTVSIHDIPIIKVAADEDAL